MTFFSLLEVLTYSYADLIIELRDCDESRYEASRWLTSLGFVYDKVYTHLDHAVMRHTIFKRSANYLAKLEPEDLNEWAATRYSEAWQLWDGGSHDAAFNLFNKAADKLIAHQREWAFADLRVQFMAQELYVIILALAPQRQMGAAMRLCLTTMLNSYSSGITIDNVIADFGAGHIVMDGPPHDSTTCDTIILTSYFDLHTASLIGQAMRRQFRRTPTIIFIPTETCSDKHLERYLVAELNIIIGAPDTPGPIGQLVSQLDKELDRIYQLRMMGDFGAVIDGQSTDGTVIHFLSACGLAGNLTAWWAFVDRHSSNIRLEHCKMDRLLIDFLLIPLVAAAEGRVFNQVMDSLSARLRRDKDATHRALLGMKHVKPDKLDEFIGKLDGDVKAAITDVANVETLAQVLDDAMLNLRASDLDPNQLQSISCVAYDMAVWAQRQAKPGSNIEMNISPYVTAFRNQRSAIAIIKREYMANAILDYKRFNEAADRLAQALQNFKMIAKA